MQAGDKEGSNNYVAATATAVSAILSNTMMCAAILAVFNVLYKLFPVVWVSIRNAGSLFAHHFWIFLVCESYSCAWTQSVEHLLQTKRVSNGVTVGDRKSVV